MFVDPRKFHVDEALVKASQQFRQGHLLKDVPVSYTAPPESAMTDEGRGGKQEGVLRSVEYAMMLTQTCDLRNVGKIHSIPLVNVAAVYDAKDYVDEKNQPLLKNLWKMPYLVRLSSTSLPTDKGQVWVADMHYDMPIDRGYLLGRDPIAGFDGERGYIDAARRISAHRLRPAIDDGVRKHVLGPLAKFMKAKKLRNMGLREVWIGGFPDVLEPKAVKLVFLVADEAAREKVEEAVYLWHSEDLADAVAGQPFKTRVPQIVTAAKFTREDEADTMPVDVFEDEWLPMPTDLFAGAEHEVQASNGSAEAEVPSTVEELVRLFEQGKTEPTGLGAEPAEARQLGGPPPEKPAG